MSGMEAALASGVLKVAGGKLVSLIASEFASITGVKKDLCELQGKHLEISSWLAVVRDRATGSGTSPPWVNELRNVAYDIEDLLYEVHLEAEKHKIYSDGDKQLIADCFCAKPKSFLFRCKVARKVKAIKVKYDKIVKQASDANTISHNLQKDHPAQSNKEIAARERSILCNVEDSKIPRRDQEKEEILNMILEPKEVQDGRPMIVSIVGLGGSGKTTLANHICHDKKIKEHFKDTLFWVHVSEEFDIKKLISKLFQAITKQKSDLHAEEHMLSEISNTLRSNKFLLVLDDAWHKERDGWEKFMVHLKGCAPASKIILTTRDKKVAELVRSSRIFELGLLSKAENWSLFLESSEWVEDDFGSEYIIVGKEILDRCGGVPLAIKILGGILCENKEISIWRAIGDSDLWTNKSIEESVFACLKLSFTHLADEIKQCFTVCSIFPKGCEIYKDRLIAQWATHGFINEINGVQPEDTGSAYFDSLVKVGFLQTPFKRWPTDQIVCTMHDLVHDLTRHILQDEVVTCLPNNMTTNYTQRCRYLSLTSCAEKVNRGSFDKVHALYITVGNPSFKKLVKNSCYVRSVTLQSTVDAPISLFVMKFECLAYLEIRNLHCEELPKAISGCWNLQALLLISCSGLLTLPESIGKLKKLRILELDDIGNLESLPESIGDCQDLQSLQLYDCQHLRNIPGTISRNTGLRVLRIGCCWNLEQLPSESIGDFCNLREINLSRCWRFQNLPTILSCTKLCTLDLCETKVTMLPQWVTSISTLECINLEGCSELVELPNGIGKLKMLAVLNIVGCTKLRCMPSGFGQLTRLRQLGLFVVGCDADDAGISDLENFDMLSGTMKIRNLMYLKDPCDAERACIKQKNNIQKLQLDWSWSEPLGWPWSEAAEEESAPDTALDQGVVSALEPPSQIVNLQIEGYRGTCLPWWLMENIDSCYFEAKTLKQTGPCQFLHLTELKLSECPNLTHLTELLKFPALKSLELSEMANLEELWTTTGGFEIRQGDIGAQNCFPVLSKLCIKYCPKLCTVKPYFPPSLEALYLREINPQLLSPGNFAHLLASPANESSSSSSQHPKSQHPHQHHCKLEALDIYHSNDLTQLPESIRSLTSLQQLAIYHCRTLCALPEWLGELRSLRDLDVTMTPKIGSLPQSIGQLTSLTTLRISWWGDLKLLPDEIQNLASLESLELVYCDELTVLPECIGQLPALQTLWIQSCSALQCLPQSIQHLTSLQTLDISGCPALATRYKQGAGPDWQLVSHIPHVIISED